MVAMLDILTLLLAYQKPVFEYDVIVRELEGLKLLFKGVLLLNFNENETAGKLSIIIDRDELFMVVPYTFTWGPFCI